MSPGPRRNSLKKKTRGKKSRGTVPLNSLVASERSAEVCYLAIFVSFSQLCKCLAMGELAIHDSLTAAELVIDFCQCGTYYILYR